MAIRVEHLREGDVLVLGGAQRWRIDSFCGDAIRMREGPTYEDFSLWAFPKRFVQGALDCGAEVKRKEAPRVVQQGCAHVYPYASQPVGPWVHIGDHNIKVGSFVKLVVIPEGAEVVEWEDRIKTTTFEHDTLTFHYKIPADRRCLNFAGKRVHVLAYPVEE